jgi:hypothetical protein
MLIIIANAMAFVGAAGAGATPDFEIKTIEQYVRLPFQQPFVTKERPAGPVLVGGGQLTMEFDARDFPVDLIDEEYGNFGRYEIGFDATGKVASCGKVDSGLEAAGEVVCTMIRKLARFQFAPGYELDAPAGYIPIYVNWQERVFITEPITFTKREKGIKVQLNYTYATRKKQAECEIYDDSFKARALRSKNRSEKWVTAWLKPKQPAPQAESVVTWSQTDYDYGQTKYIYPNAFPANAQFLTSAMGAFVWDLKFTDRPNEINSDGTAKIALSINPDGTVNSCKPYHSSASLGLDLKACQIAKERGRFNFAPGKNTGTEIRYLAVDVNWPQE